MPDSSFGLTAPTKNQLMKLHIIAALAIAHVAGFAALVEQPKKKKPPVRD